MFNFSHSYEWLLYSSNVSFNINPTYLPQKRDDFLQFHLRGTTRQMTSMDLSCKLTGNAPGLLLYRAFFVLSYVVLGCHRLGRHRRRGACTIVLVRWVRTGTQKLEKEMKNSNNNKQQKTKMKRKERTKKISFNGHLIIIIYIYSHRYLK